MAVVEPGKKITIDGTTYRAGEELPKQAKKEEKEEKPKPKKTGGK